MTNTKTIFQREFVRTEHSGWLEVGAVLPEGSTAKICGEAVVFKEAASKMYGGTFNGGTFNGGTFYDGTFKGGTFNGGTFRGGEFYDGVFRGGWFNGGWFHGGTFRGGEFSGGEFYNGEFRGGEFYDGVFRGGVFRGGVFYQTPCSAARSDGYVFAAKFVRGELRIWAGCRNFSWEEAVAHWNDSHHLGKESQRIINFLKAQAEAEHKVLGK